MCVFEAQVRHDGWQVVEELLAAEARERATRRAARAGRTGREIILPLLVGGGGVAPGCTNGRFVHEAPFLAVGPEIWASELNLYSETREFFSLAIRLILKVFSVKMGAFK